MSSTVEDTLRSVGDFATIFVGAVERKLKSGLETDDIELVDLIDLVTELPKEECSARALLVYNLKMYGLNQEERRAFIDLVEWGKELTLMQMPSTQLEEKLMELRNRVGDRVSIRGIAYPAHRKRMERWLR